MKEEDISSNSKELEVEKSAKTNDDEKLDGDQSEITVLKKEKEELEQKNKELTDKMDFLKRQVAATVNHYRQEYQNKLSTLERNRADKLKEMVGLFQELSRVIKNTETEEEISLFTGLRNKVQSVIDNNDGKIISPEIGADFDPREHKGISQKNTEDKNQHGKIAELLTSGIKMGNKVVVPANVVTFAGD